MSNELIFGFHSVEAILAKEPERFLEIYALKGRDDKRLTPIIDEARSATSTAPFQLGGRQTYCTLLGYPCTPPPRADL